MFTDRKYAIARRWSNRELRRIAPIFDGAVVNVSAWMDADKEGSLYRDYFSNASDYYITNYRGDRGYQGISNEYELDLTKELPEGLHQRFDVAFNHTTLEHVFDVVKAFDNICRMSRDVVILVVPFCQVQHESESWKDYWRFTPTCMRSLFARNEFSVIYEAANKHRNAGTYLFFVASRCPERWQRQMPPYNRIDVAANWIGENAASHAVALARRAGRRFVKGRLGP